ncbi:hypothetical protein ACFQGE_18495 [Halomicroarcula sp. GCM10025817]|uniref:hypothetical protein n=1 Tax=Haloarcula TaxID=2237 RepID=UPI0023E84140|nr:hypothetical protein [Halomicroarcula sp. SYNS111]
MTSTEPFTMDGVDEFSPPDERRKAVLFCPDCGHEIDLRDDWESDERGDHEQLRCPVCRTVVDTD